MSTFVHLHVHTQYSILDGMSSIPALFKKADADRQVALAITDHGNMFGVKEFLKTAKHYPSVKPVVGCEVYINPEGRHVKRGREDQSANHLILLAKNMQGYKNLVKLVSLGYVEGMYYKPKIDHELLEQYHEGLIACSACLAGEVQKAILQQNLGKAEEVMLWYRHLFGNDYYLEIQRHKTGDPNADCRVYPLQQEVAAAMTELARKHSIRIIASNDVHFVNADDAEAHDRLICLNTGADLDSPTRMRYTKQEWMKTQAEMAALFADLPEALANTLEIAEKIEVYDIDNKPVMPYFPLPEGFTDSNDYLRKLSYVGAAKRYPELTGTIRERLDFELDTMKAMGFPDYFLIVQDFIAAARSMGVVVGPGRGSAAGSVAAYCLGITDIDPLKYNLLFERFLNPDRISMPDIDIDFDDDGRAKVLKYVEEKYGKDHVSHVITFGTMATKSAIKDVARVQKLPLSESDRLSKAIPARWDRRESTGKALPISIATCMEHVPEIKQAAESGNDLLRETMKYAEMLEGSIRNTGVHACAIIIGRNNLMEHIPIFITKDKDTGEDMWVSQYEGSCIEDVGMLKMDFLGLKTLSILRDTVDNIRLARREEVVLERIPLDDRATYELFSRGDTVATFQFESDGMRKWLRELKPTRIDDLIAMNALYRPGPMDYIPDFVARKHGRAKIVYDLPEMEEYLADTYGVTVYQEQVMLLSQKLAGFTKGQADTLRKAMGKKQRSVLDKMKDDFLRGTSENGHDAHTCEKIWKDWESFAEYAFNKSHSTCYAWLGYQTAYLKANYPAEYMAAVLSRNLYNIDDISKCMDECRRMDIEVLPPDVNESNMTFTVNRQGNVRFGLGAVKGVGAGAVASIVDERTRGGAFRDIFDFVERVNLQACNKKTMEALSQSGAFDSIEGITREQFFAENAAGETFTEVLLRFGNKMQTDRQMNQNSLFGGINAVAITRPEIPHTDEWNILEKLNREKELIGMYLSAHPLDPYKLEMKHLASMQLADFQSPMTEGREFAVAGLVTAARDTVGKNGKPWGSLTLEDFSGSHEFRFFNKDYDLCQKYLREGLPLFLRGSIQRNYRNELEPKIRSIAWISDIREQLKSILITLPLDHITDEWINELNLNIEAGKGGNVLLRFRITDPETNRTVEMFSRKQRIKISREFTDRLERAGLEFKLN